MSNTVETNYKIQGHIHSLNGQMDEITVLCHALFNWFVCEYFVDDLYRVVGDNE